MRCLALAEAWQERGGSVVFALASAPRDLEERLDAEGFARARIAGRPGDAEDARETAALARGGAADCLVLDGYHFDSAYRRALGPLDARLLAVVDGACGDAAGADYVLDQNLGASRPGTSGEAATGGSGAAPDTRYLLGPRYALLRREFWRWRGRAHPIAPAVRRILVTMGGGDSANVTGRALRALRTLPEAGELEVRIVVGPSNPHRTSLEAELAGVPAAWRLLPAQRDMSELFAWADLALSAAGSTCWELAFMGLPFVTVVLAENQHRIAAALAGAGVSRDLGWHEQVSAEGVVAQCRELLDAPALRSEMSRLGQETVDGFGAERVAAVLSAVAA
jgi:UDP-2,4-diacetamido-2,4,6-trideoxy-beta-L-altropyranose hydrolase